MIEAYEATATTHHRRADRFLVQQAAIATHGSTTVRLADGTEHDLGGDWAQVTLFGALSEALGEPVDVTTSMDRLVLLAEKHDVAVLAHYGPGKLVEELFEALVVPGLVGPVFVRDYPRRSPLTGRTARLPVWRRSGTCTYSHRLATGYSDWSTGGARGASPPSPSAASATTRRCG